MGAKFRTVLGEELRQIAAFHRVGFPARIAFSQSAWRDLEGAELDPRQEGQVAEFVAGGFVVREYFPAVRRSGKGTDQQPAAPAGPDLQASAPGLGLCRGFGGISISRLKREPFAQDGSGKTVAEGIGLIAIQEPLRLQARCGLEPQPEQGPPFVPVQTGANLGGCAPNG